MPLSRRIWADPNSRRYLRKRSSVLPSGGRSGPDGRATHHPPGSHTGQPASDLTASLWPHFYFSFLFFSTNLEHPAATL